MRKIETNNPHEWLVIVKLHISPNTLVPNIDIRTFHRTPHFFTFPPESFKLYLPGTQQIQIQTWTVESVILMNTLLCAAHQTDRISLPSAIDRIQVTNYSWTHERDWMKLCLKHQLGYKNKCTLLPFMHSKFMKTESIYLSFFLVKRERRSNPVPIPT